MKTNNCVIAAVGKDSLHREWIKDKDDINFDLHLMVYDDSASQYEADTRFIYQAKGRKLRLVYEYLRLHPEYIDRYDYFLLADDDISATAKQISDLFAAMEKYKLKIAQPALTDSYYSFRHTLQDKRYKLRYTNFVEMMFPCFSHEALKKVLCTFNENPTGWGVEYHWARLVGDPRHNMAIIDEVAVRHTRPLQSWTCENFRYMHDYIRKYGLSKQIEVYSSIPSGTEHGAHHSGMVKQAVLLVTHFYDEHVLKKYERLRKELHEDTYDIYLLYNTDNKRETYRIPESVNACIYNLDDINSLGYESIMEEMLPGSCHFPVLKFYKDYPSYSHYWFIEYDVEFTSSWNMLLDAFRRKRYDFISSCVEKYDAQNNGDWYWWKRFNNVGYPLEKCVKAFNPICRYSNRALRYIDKFQKAGHSAHSELLIATCLYNAGYSIADFGGKNDFVSYGNIDRFYINRKYPECSTMRYRPIFTREEMAGQVVSGKLYHPVK
ncbi:MAG: DUF707 domain-containing protein [Bacteroides sp.]|nr:DUF707 domain-containing protein [Roseburia sp.]MCM1347462.1 DUF707 domain-containing protein [Bacteroides sp.]MCM1421933.1 DUF707 domain-containing protein [Bacteroides sp.]